MKQKDSNINKNITFQLAKGLIILILLFFTENNWAQKIVEKSIISSANKIIIDFNLVDEVELISWNQPNKIVIVAESETDSSPIIFIEEKSGIVFIKSMENNFEQNAFDIDKQCTVQPLYASYRIKIPKNKSAEILVNQGNFYTNNFEGDLNLKIETGIVKLDKFDGSVNMQINMGKVYVNALRNTKIDVTSNLGKVTSNLLIQDKDKNHVKGVLGKNNNSLNIHAILANIQLKSLKD